MAETVGSDNAFSSIAEFVEHRGDVDKIEILGSEGLSKREYFAAKAMQGFMVNAPLQIDHAADFIRLRADDAVLAADALVTALNKKKVE